MPGPVSDSYDPEFSTSNNAYDVRKAIRKVLDRIESGPLRGKPAMNILEVVHGEAGRLHAGPLAERDWRVIRFCLNRAAEDI
jgi:Flp pilus assembly CpaF family ATPase